MDKRIILIFVMLIGALAIALFGSNSSSKVESISLVQKGKVVDAPDSIYYFPDAYNSPNNQEYFPLVVAFSPGGDANELIAFWKHMAEKHRFIVYASKVYHNDMPMNDSQGSVLERIYNSIRNFTMTYRVDTRKIIYTGVSGGGSFSYQMEYLIPNVAYGLIINTGRMWEDTAYYPMYNNIAGTKAAITKKPKVAMLASPTDFRYNDMKRDRDLINKLEWDNIWLEFEGGHRLAPNTLYDQALEWMLK